MRNIIAVGSRRGEGCGRKRHYCVVPPEGFLVESGTTSHKENVCAMIHCIGCSTFKSHTRSSRKRTCNAQVVYLLFFLSFLFQAAAQTVPRIRPKALRNFGHYKLSFWWSYRIGPVHERRTVFLSSLFLFCKLRSELACSAIRLFFGSLLSRIRGFAIKVRIMQ